MKKFTTELGSVYHQLLDGRYQRRKFDGSIHEPQDITVFLDIGPEKTRLFLTAIHQGMMSDRKVKVYVTDKDGNVINDNAIAASHAVVVFVDKWEILAGVKCSSVPTKGHTVLEQRRYVENDMDYRSIHMGHRVI